MAGKMMEALKGMNREERLAYFSENKPVIPEDRLETVNGGVDARRDNPNSSQIPFQGNWFSSDGYVCDGEVIC